MRSFWAAAGDARFMFIEKRNFCLPDIQFTTGFSPPFLLLSHTCTDLLAKPILTLRNGDVSPLIERFVNPNRP